MPVPCPLVSCGRTQNLYVTRVTNTVYTFGFLLMTLKYFFSGPPDKSNRARQRARLVHAYMVTLAALLAPVLVSEPAAAALRLAAFFALFLACRQSGWTASLLNSLAAPVLAAWAVTAATPNVIGQ